jgi:hypothetical protein
VLSESLVVTVVLIALVSLSLRLSLLPVFLVLRLFRGSSSSVFELIGFALAF